MISDDIPAARPLLMAVRAGFARLCANSHDGLRNKTEPLPAAALLHIVNLVL